MSDVPAVTDATFEAEVLKSATPVLVDFYATWCGPCKRLGPIVEEVAREQAGKVKVVKMDTDANQEVAGRLGIMALPTLVFFKGGAEVKRVMGLVAKPKILELMGL